MIDSILMQKAGLATRGVARIMASLRVGDRVPAVTELCERLGTARGNIQLAIGNLKKLKAVELRSRGHLGTYIENIDYLKLLETCGIKEIAGVMPLPYSKRYEGLATGIYSACNLDGLRTGIAFMRGAENRIRNLYGGRYDFVVLSKLSFDYYIQQGRLLKEICNFGDYSYVGKHMVIVPKGFSGNWRQVRVGIDDSSVDQRLLTLSYFSDKPAVFVPMKYNQLFSYLQKRQIDAAIWNTDDIDLDAKGLAALELGDLPECAKGTQAIIACRQDDNLTIRLLGEMLSVSVVKRQQQEVVDGNRVPRY
jgi:hypothetical protein